MTTSPPPRFVASAEAQLRHMLDPLAKLDALIRPRVVPELAAEVHALHVVMERIRRRLRDMPRDVLPPMKLRRGAAKTTDATTGEE